MTGKQYPEGQLVATWIGICIALSAGFGIVLAVSTDNPGLIGIGPAIGVALGVAIGTGLENKYRQDGRIRPLKPAERRRHRRAVVAAVVILLIGVLLTFAAMLW